MRLAGRPMCRATQQRAPPTRGGQAVAAAEVIWLVAEQRPQRARVAHTIGPSVSSRWCWCSCARCARERSGSRELPHSRHTGKLKLHALLHHVRAVPFELLFFPLERRLRMSLQVKFDSFCDHAAQGRLADVQRMLESGELGGYGNLNEALVLAAEHGHVDVVDYLLRHAMFDPSDYGNFAIRLAAQCGHLAVVERLLRDERVDPSADDNYAIQLAAQNGHLSVVERLLQDKRVDPSADNNCAVRQAAYFGHLAVVERLLRDERVDPSANDNRAIQLAAFCGHLAVFERLQQDERVDPSASNNYAVRLAAQLGRLAVVERLLQDLRVDPSADDNDAVRLAAAHGHFAVVERLLQDKRVDPSADDNYAVREAAQRGHFAIVERLLEDDRVDAAVAIRCSLPEDRKRFECRERLTEICIALQDLELPAWVTIKILYAARPWSTLPLHSKWSLVCAVKHFRDRKEQ